MVPIGNSSEAEKIPDSSTNMTRTTARFMPWLILGKPYRMLENILARARQRPSFWNLCHALPELIIRRQASAVTILLKPSRAQRNTTQEKLAMKTKWMASITILALVLCGGAVLSYAQGPGPGGPGWGHGPGPMGHMFRDLNLTDAQRQQVKSIMEANKATMHTLMQQMEQNRLAMLQATSNGAYNQAAIQTLANQQAQLMAQMTMQHQALQHQVYTQVLTADQQAKFNQHVTDEINHITQHLQDMQSGATPPPAE
jgi:periplasmic protein CpxP/Spy